MAGDPWPDPDPGDFDAYLRSVDPSATEYHGGNADARVTMLVGVDADDARRPSELAAERNTSVREIVAQLVRNA